MMRTLSESKTRSSVLSPLEIETFKEQLNAKLHEAKHPAVDEMVLLVSGIALPAISAIQQAFTNECSAELWVKVFTNCYRVERFRELDKVFLSRMGPDSALDLNTLKILDEIFQADRGYIDCFLKNATTFNKKYYSSAKLTEIFRQFQRFLKLYKGIAAPASHLVYPFDRGGNLQLSNCCEHFEQMKELHSKETKWQTLLHIDSKDLLHGMCHGRSNGQFPLSSTSDLNGLLSNEAFRSAFSLAEKRKIAEILKELSGHQSEDERLSMMRTLRDFKELHAVETFTTLLSSPILRAQKSLHIACAALEKCNREKDLFQDAALLTCLQSNEISPTIFLHRLNQISEEAFARQYTETELKGVLHKFDHQKFGLSGQDLQFVESEYKAIFALGPSLRGETVQEWQLRLDEVRAFSSKQTINATRRHLVIAIGREAMRLKFGIYPYNTQMLTLLGVLGVPGSCDSLRGRIAQVKTGEGKSTVIALLTFYLACQGKCVDIVSSSRYLAKRDWAKYRSFFAEFGMKSSHICTISPTPQQLQGQILYGTNADFELALMRHQLFENRHRILEKAGHSIDRPFNAVIVDEVDNLFIDSARDSARMAILSPWQASWVYPKIYEMVNASKAACENFIQKNDTSICDQNEYATLRRRLIEEKEFSLHFDIDRQLKTWIDSALRARYIRKLNRDYVIHSGKPSIDSSAETAKEIVIVDAVNTGRIKMGCRWTRGEHEFLEIKHGLIPKRELLTIASMSHARYFSKYSKIYGLTGTLGEEQERRELAEVYNVDTFDVPTHLENKRQDLPTIVCATADAHKRALTDEIAQLQNAHRPILLLFSTIDETLEFAEHLKATARTVEFAEYRGLIPLKFQILNDIQQEHEDQIVDKAGLPKQITIATNTAGRGTDIHLASESRARGGLHVVYTFYPESTRVETQGLGRAARQGQLGSSRMILLAPPEVQHLDDYRASLPLQRCIKEHHTYSERQHQLQLEAIHGDYLERFFKDLKRWEEALQPTSLEKLAEDWIAKSKSDRPECDLDHHATLKGLLSLKGDFRRCEELARHATLERAKSLWIAFFENFKSSMLEAIKLDWTTKFYHNLVERAHQPGETFSTKLSSDARVQQYKEMASGLYESNWRVFKKKNLDNPLDGFAMQISLLRKQ